MSTTKHRKDTKMRCSRKLLSVLKSMGKKGDTYEDVIWRLINEVKLSTTAK